MSCPNLELRKLFVVNCLVLWGHRGCGDVPSMFIHVLVHSLPNLTSLLHVRHSPASCLL